MSIRVNVILNEHDLREAAMTGSTDDVRELIRGLDIAVGEVDFTEEVIKMLARSVAGDMDAEDYKRMLTELATYKTLTMPIAI